MEGLKVRGQEMDSEDIYYSFISGANEVIKEKLELNRINVFPIADGDTGNNLAYTMNSIIENAELLKTPKETLASIADAALMGARGNSGIIFAQFVNGLYMETTEDEAIGLSDFAFAMNKAGDYAYEAISNPVEGTMVTVISEWADSLSTLAESTRDFKEMLADSLKVALVSLSETPEKLQVLKDANVVDSGAKGFVHFIEGFAQFLATGQVENLKSALGRVEFQEDAIDVHENFDSSYRYCVEGILQGEDLELVEMKSKLETMGDSLIMAGNNQKMRLHIHTDDPEEVFYFLKDYGKITFQKADDMRRQYESIYDRKHEIAILTDSIADLPKEIMDEHQIHLLPLNIIIDDVNYLDKLTISSNYFYELMDELKTYPSSAQITVKEAEKALLDIAVNYDEIIAITVSSKMSGTYDSLVKASQHPDLENKRIKIIDSKQNSGAEGLVVKKAAEALDAGHDFDELVAIVEETIKKTSIFVSVPTLEYMLKSGRIGKAQAFAANMVNLKPVVAIDEDGNGIVIGNAFSTRGNMRKIQELVKNIMEENSIESYAIIHSNAGERMTEFKQYYTDLIGRAPDYTMDISSIVAMSAGVGVVAIALTTK